MPRRDNVDHADDAIALAAGYGLTADEWQEFVLEGWLGELRGKWASPRCGLAVPRQNGKNGVLEIRELYGMVALGERILHTAHEVKTARKAFARLLWFFDNEREFPELHDLVSEIRRTNGQEAIFLTNGGSVEFIARSKGSGRGFTVDVLVCDEAQELSDDALAALLPTISAAPLGNPQLILTGTPPAPSMTGEVFTRMRQAGVEGKEKRLCWLEWSCPADADIHDLANVAAANPALGRRLNMDTITDELAAMDAATFARERLGVWNEAAGLAVFGVGRFEACCVDSLAAGAQAFGIAVSRDRSIACIGAASIVGGRLQIKPLRHGPGVSWIEAGIAEVVGEHSTPVVIDKGGPAAYLIPVLQEQGFTVVEVGLSEYADACARVYDAAQPREDGTVELAHDNNPALKAAVVQATWREVGDRRVWGRKGGDITALESSTLAAAGAIAGLDYDPLDSIY